MSSSTSDSDIAISVRGLSKKYTIGRHAKQSATIEDWFVEKTGRMKGWFSGERMPGSSPETEFWALKDISFDIEKGEVVGIIGRNGAGKSTLLKVLSRITAPTTGRIEIDGRIDSLLEVGTGFHQEMTGRENIYMNAALHGLTRREIDARMEDIIKFSGVEAFLDTPVKHYSSGMGVRLGFAVAAHMDPDILVVDEVLAVGDAEFQNKCIGKMKEVSEGGRTVLFVSHNMGAISQLCSRVLELQNGKMIHDGDSISTVNHYLHTISGSHFEGELTWDQSSKGPGTDRIRLYRIRLMQKGIARSSFVMEEPIEIVIEFINYLDNIKNIAVTVFIRDISGTLIFNAPNITSANLRNDNWFNLDHVRGIYRSIMTIPPSTLNDGRYFVGIFITELDGRPSDVYEDYLISFEVIDSGNLMTPGMGKWGGLLRMKFAWRTEMISSVAPVVDEK